MAFARCNLASRSDFNIGFDLRLMRAFREWHPMRRHSDAWMMMSAAPLAIVIQISKTDRTASPYQNYRVARCTAYRHPRTFRQVARFHRRGFDDGPQALLRARHRQIV